MDVRKRPGSPYFMADFVVAGKRYRQSTGETTKAKAKVAAEALRARLLATAEVDDKGRRAITLREAMELYSGSLEAAGKASAKEARRLTLKVVGEGPFAGRHHIPGDRLLHTLEPADLERVIQARQGEGNKAQTIAHELKHIRVSVHYAKGLRYRIPEIDNWRLPKVPQKTRYLSREEWLKVFNYLDPTKCRANVRAARQEAQDLLVALTLCGGRWSEVAGLTWDRVDPEAGVIRIYGSKTQKERLVPLAAQFRAVLERRRWQGSNSQSHLVFPALKTNGKREGSCRPILHAMNACGLNRPDIVSQYGTATVHSLRHTFASWLLQGDGNGQRADLSEVQETLGHTTLQMTRRYAHLSGLQTLTRLAGILDAPGATSRAGNTFISPGGRDAPRPEEGPVPAGD